MDTTKRYYNSKQAAEYLGVSLGTLYKYRQKGIVPGHRPFGRSYYFDRVELDAAAKNIQCRKMGVTKNVKILI